jgi:hypothetical protein
VLTDFNTSLPEVHGKDYISGTSSEYEAPQVAEWFFREVFRLHRVPEYIDHDRDNIVLRTFWQELYRLAWHKVDQCSTVGVGWYEK